MFHRMELRCLSAALPFDYDFLVWEKLIIHGNEPIFI
jgi:hypothetical protein